MDLDANLSGSCKTSFKQKHKTQTYGQGDSKCSGKIKEDFSSLEGMKKSKKDIKDSGKKNEKFRADGEITESQKTLPDKNKEIECKSTLESRVENDEQLKCLDFTCSEINRVLKEKTCCCSENSLSEKLITACLLQLFKKVDYLLQKQIHHCFTEKCPEQAHMKFPKDLFENFRQLYDLNKRICNAEKGIENLRQILEKHIENSNKKQERSDKIICEPKTRHTQKRIDWDTCSVNDILVSSTVEEICSKLGVLKKEEDSKQKSIHSVLFFKEQNELEDKNQKEMIENLKKLRIQTNENQDKLPSSCEIDELYNLVRSAKEEEIGIRHAKNKLEVISEQGEYHLHQKTENEQTLNNSRKIGEVIQPKKKVSPVRKDRCEKQIELCDSTSRLLVQEALLKTYLDQIQCQLYSKLDTTVIDFPENQSQSIFNNIIPNTNKEENIYKTESDIDSFSDDTCLFCEAENEKRKPPSESPQEINKSFTQEKCEKPGKENRNFTAKVCYEDSNCKVSGKASKQSEEQLYDKKQKAASPATQKPSQNLLDVPEPVSHIPGKVRNPTSKVEQRPLTAPSPRKRYSTSGLTKSPSKNCVKLSVQEGKIKTDSGNNIVKHKNKSLLCKKSFFGAS